MEQTNSLEIFNLQQAGQSADVRILFTTTNGITKVPTHRIKNGDKTKRVKCLGTTGDGCPCCKAGVPVENRLIVHLYDYTDGKEKVWDRTDNARFLQSLVDVEQMWGNLCDVPVRITRDSQDFPTYSVAVLPAQQFPPVQGMEIGKDCSFRFGFYRSKEELDEALRTGVVPPHVKKPKVDNMTPPPQYGSRPATTPYNAQSVSTPNYTAPTYSAPTQPIQTPPASNSAPAVAPTYATSAQSSTYTPSADANIYAESLDDEDLPF